MNFRVHLKIHIIIMWLFRAPTFKSKDSCLESQNFWNIPNFSVNVILRKLIYHHKRDMHDVDEAF